MSKQSRSIRLAFSTDEHRQVRLAAAFHDQSPTAFARGAVLSAVNLSREGDNECGAPNSDSPGQTKFQLPFDTKGL
jgi:hypothetical protein